MRLLVFTDLDGTLLDHDTYAWEAARPVLERLRVQGMPLVLVTSKTRAEVEPLRSAMELDDPYVVENGAGAFFPSRFDGWEIPDARRVDGRRAIVLGRDYVDARAFMREVGHGFGARGFGDMSLAEVVERTGLPEDGAERARARDFSEPFILENEDRLPELERAARRAGFSLTRGGRFHHLIGAEQDKGEAVRRIRDAYAWNEVGPWSTIGLGDGPNDLPMLEAVDYAVVMPVRGREAVHVDATHARVAPEPGPTGWAASLSSLIDELEG